MKQYTLSETAAEDFKELVRRYLLSPQDWAGGFGIGRGRVGSNETAFVLCGSKVADIYFDMWHGTVQVFDAVLRTWTSYGSVYLVDANGGTLFAGNRYLALRSGDHAAVPVFLTDQGGAGAGDDYDFDCGSC